MPVKRASTRILVLAAVLALLVSAAAAAQQRRPVLGTGVSLVPPPGFTWAAALPGFERREMLARIRVHQIDAPHAELADTLRASMTVPGVRIVSDDTVTVDGRAGALLNVTRDEEGVEFEQLILVLENARGASLLVATFPRELAGKLRGSVRTALLTARHEEGPPSEAPPPEFSGTGAPRGKPSVP